MAQFVTRVDNDLAEDVDRLVTEGIVKSRSDAVRRGLHVLVEQARRRRVADEIVDGYLRSPQTDEEVAWADEATVKMIGDEPW